MKYNGTRLISDNRFHMISISLSLSIFLSLYLTLYAVSKGSKNSEYSVVFGGMVKLKHLHRIAFS